MSGPPLGWLLCIATIVCAPGHAQASTGGQSAEKVATCLVGQPEWHWYLAPNTGEVPSERDPSGSVVVAPDTGELWVFGGLQAPKPADHCSFRDELFRAAVGPTAAWTLVSDAAITAPTHPLGRFAVAVWDQAASRLVLYGGYSECKPICDDLFGPECTPTLDDLWVYHQATGWQRQMPTGGPPLGRYAAQAVFDPQLRRWFVHGGLNFSLDVVGDTWALELSKEPPIWRQVSPESVGPGLRATGFHWFDSDRRLFVLAGGRRCFASQCPNNFLDDAWALSLGSALGSERWWPIQLDTPMPTTFTGSTCAYDPVTKQGVCYGGHLRPLGPNDAWGLPNRELWAFQWTGARSGSFRLVPTGEARPTVTNASLVYHPTLDAFIIFGGWNSGDKTYNELWIAERQCVPGPANRRPVPPVMP